MHRSQTLMPEPHLRGLALEGGAAQRCIRHVQRSVRLAMLRSAIRGMVCCARQGRAVLVVAPGKVGLRILPANLHARMYTLRLSSIIAASHAPERDNT